VEEKQIQTLVNDLGRKLVDRPDSWVSLTEFLVLASTAVLNRQQEVLADGAQAQAAHEPSPYTGISFIEALRLVLEGLAKLQGLLLQAELELPSIRYEGELAVAA